MRGTLALVGGAEWTDGCDFDRGLLERSGAKEVVIVPTAAAYESPQLQIDRAKSWFGALGAETKVVNIFRRAEALADGAADILDDASFVYIGGGSPMHLRSVLKSTPVWDGIVSVLERGGVVAASAEGAAVMSTHMVDSRGGAFTVGLNLLDEMTVIARYNLWSEDKLHRTLQLAPTAMAVVGIDERTALIWDGTSWTTEGEGGVVAFKHGKKIDIADIPVPG